MPTDAAASQRTSAPPSSARPAVHVRDLHKRYGATPAVTGLELTVETGEIFAILGPNGAGKTTTVEILEGFRRRDRGEVRVLGTDPERADRDWRSRIGIVLQSVDDAAELTVREMIRHVARFYPAPRDPEELIEAVGLSAKAMTRVRRLSGGQRRRLDVALGIVGRPELLFLDEPTTGFDPEARRSFWDLVLSLRADGTTILLTTHYLDEAEHLADRCAVVRDGQVVALDAPRAIGGRSAREVVVRWHEDGTPHERRTSTPTAVVAELLARHAPGEVPGLEVLRPTLEDVYLELVGQTRRVVDTDPAQRHTPIEEARR